MLIKKYTTDWIDQFLNIKREIDKGLNGLSYRVEHIGSTSVPNLDSKDIIDLDIVYDQPSDFARIKGQLIEIGYYHNGDQGIEEREVFKRRPPFTHEVLDHITHHLYVCPADSTALARHLLSRDLLRKNEWARLKYQSMKYEIAARVNQIKKQYAELKELTVNDFIDSIIAIEKTNAKHE